MTRDFPLARTHFTERSISGGLIIYDKYSEPRSFLAGMSVEVDLGRDSPSKRTPCAATFTLQQRLIFPGSVAVRLFARYTESPRQFVNHVGRRNATRLHFASAVCMFLRLPVSDRSPASRLHHHGCVEADLEMRQRALDKLTPASGEVSRYEPTDKLPAFPCLALMIRPPARPLVPLEIGTDLLSINQTSHN